jgi:hypothetical protein
MSKDEQQEITSDSKSWRNKRLLGDRVSLPMAGLGLVLVSSAGVGYMALKRKQNKAKLKLLSR